MACLCWLSHSQLATAPWSGGAWSRTACELWESVGLQQGGLRTLSLPEESFPVCRGVKRASARPKKHLPKSDLPSVASPCSKSRVVGGAKRGPRRPPKGIFQDLTYGQWPAHAQRQMLATPLREVSGVKKGPRRPPKGIFQDLTYGQWPAHVLSQMLATSQGMERGPRSHAKKPRCRLLLDVRCRSPPPWSSTAGAAEVPAEALPTLSITADRLRFLTFETDAADTLVVPQGAGASTPSAPLLRRAVMGLLFCRLPPAL